MSKGKILRWSLTSVAAAALLGPASGCNRAWEVYQQIELGKPLAAEGLLTDEGRTEGAVRAWDDYAVVHLPAVVKSWSVRAVLNDAGHVMGKYYLENDMAHWLVFRTAAYRWVMEVEVPEAAFNAPPPGRKRRATTQPSAASATNAPQCLAAVNREARAVYAKPRRKGWFLDRATIGLFFWWGFVPWTEGGSPDMRQIGDHPDLLSHATRAGYDRTWRNSDGGSCRIRNLGGRRIRIESSYSGLFDTIRVAAWKKDSYGYTVETDPRTGAMHQTPASDR